MKQVDASYYFQKKYASLERFIAYFKQIDLILNSGQEKILFIGVGDGLVVDYLRRADRRLNITTFDLDSDLKPDILGDVRMLPFSDMTFDLVVAFEVLEHLPVEQLPGILEKISQISHSSIFSLPCRQTSFEGIFKFPGIRTIFKRDYFDLKLSFPLKFPGFKESGQHYWEIDARNFSFKKIKTIINHKFKILRIESMPLDSYRLYFVLESR